MSKLEQFYYAAKSNSWYRGFTVFCRVALALGFIPSGVVKIIGERFTALPSAHPLGQYFDALHHTGFYYTFLGIGQLITAALLLIPRTALLGALIYFPTILNICILTYATRFEGTRITTMMLLASFYLLCWDYDRFKHILPFRQQNVGTDMPAQKAISRKFPFAFFALVVGAIATVVIANNYIFEIRPGNSQLECTNVAGSSKYPKAANKFCDCIYTRNKTLDECLKGYEENKKRE